MNMTRRPTVPLAIATGLFVGLLLARVPLATLLPLALVVTCPLMMLLMGHGDHGGRGPARDVHDQPTEEGDTTPTAQR